MPVGWKTASELADMLEKREPLKFDRRTGRN